MSWMHWVNIMKHPTKTEACRPKVLKYITLKQFKRSQVGPHLLEGLDVSLPVANNLMMTGQWRDFKSKRENQSKTILLDLSCWTLLNLSIPSHTNTSCSNYATTACRVQSTTGFKLGFATGNNLS